MDADVMTTELGKVTCTQCDWVGNEDALLRAFSPFDGDEMVGCPKCKSADSMVIVCDEPDCKKEATCGWPSGEGYRSTCGGHATYFKKVNYGYDQEGR